MIESEGSLTHQLLWYCSKPAYAWWHGAPTTNLGIFNTDSISWVAVFFIILVNGRLCVFNLALFWSRSLWGAEGEGPARGPPAMAARRCPAAPQDGGSAAAMGRPRPGEL